MKKETKKSNPQIKANKSKCHIEEEIFSLKGPKGGRSDTKSD
jgi:hypothetical protein